LLAGYAGPPVESIRVRARARSRRRWFSVSLCLCGSCRGRTCGVILNTKSSASQKACGARSATSRREPRA